MTIKLQPTKSRALATSARWAVPASFGAVGRTAAPFRSPPRASLLMSATSPTRRGSRLHTFVRTLEYRAIRRSCGGMIRCVLHKHNGPPTFAKDVFFPHPLIRLKFSDGVLGWEGNHAERPSPTSSDQHQPDRVTGRHTAQSDTMAVKVRAIYCLNAAAKPRRQSTLCVAGRACCWFAK